MIDALDVLLRVFHNTEQKEDQLYRLDTWLKEQGFTCILTTKVFFPPKQNTGFDIADYLTDCVIFQNLGTRRLIMGTPAGFPEYCMRLFVAGTERNSVMALNNITNICRTHLKDNHTLEIIDVFENHAAAIEENILLAPTLVIDTPCRELIIGSLKNERLILTALGIR
jgi:circadian clock protein KaiB